MNLRTLAHTLLVAAPAAGVLALGAPALGAPAQGAAPERWTLFQPLQSTTTYLVDDAGTIAHTWAGTTTAGLAVYLQPDFGLLRTQKLVAGGVGGTGGGVQRVAWDGTVEWEFHYFSADFLHHHDAVELPNGNVLLIAWEYLTRQEAIDAGRDPALLPGPVFAPDHVVEVQPTGPTSGVIVWEWHLMDHVIQDRDPTKANFGVVANHPELVDLNYPPVPIPNGDWNHVNSIDYEPVLDQILLSSHNQDEVWVIDHSTTTQQAAGHTGGNAGRGGDLLYRWGNPAAYRAGSTNDQQLFGQHDAQWIDPGLPGAGNMLVFNNGVGRPAGPFSSVEEIAPPYDGQGGYTLGPGATFGPAAPAWSYVAPMPLTFYSSGQSGCQRLSDGNTLVTDASDGRIFEVTTAGQTVWSYTNTIPNPVNNRLFKARRYDIEPAAAGYCTAKTGLVCGPASIAASGSPSAAASSGFIVSAVPTRANKSALLIYSDGGAGNAPFLGGVLCVAPPVRRSIAVPSGGVAACDGALAIDVTAFAAGALGGNPMAFLRVPGTTVHAQWWGRDSPATGTLLSDGLRYTVWP